MQTARQEEKSLFSLLHKRRENGSSGELQIPCRTQYLARSTLQLFRRSAVLLGTERPLYCYVLLEISEFGFIGRKPHENSHTAAWSLGHCCRTARTGCAEPDPGRSHRRSTGRRRPAARNRALGLSTKRS